MQGNFEFWRKWLLCSCIFFACFGLAVAVAGDTFLLAPWNQAAAEVFWQAPSFPTEFLAFKKLAFGIIGGTIVGSYTLLGFITAYPMKRREPWAIQAAIWSLLLWFVIDSGVSISLGAYFNLWMVNLLALVVKGLPMIFLYRESE
jgi:hypothetical protein